MKHIRKNPLLEILNRTVLEREARCDMWPWKFVAYDFLISTVTVQITDH
jgi:hypothetical protein